MVKDWIAKAGDFIEGGLTAVTSPRFGVISTALLLAGLRVSAEREESGAVAWDCPEGSE